MTAETETKLDLEIFKTIQTNCFSETKEEVRIANCDYLNRLVNALKYYTLLNVSNDELTEGIFVEFINVYKQVLNDYTHLVNTHSGDQ